MSDQTELWHKTQDLLALHSLLYQTSADRQHTQATALLAQTPPDFSAAATACHRALQFTRQADALDAARKELEL